MHFRIVTPKLSHKTEFLNYIGEWKNEKIVPMSTDMQGLEYEEYLKENEKKRHREFIAKDRVPATTYIMIDDTGTIYGAANLRHELNEYLLQFGGHIGYGVRPSQRGHGYAKPLLKMALKAALKHGIDMALVTCNETNIASRKTIIACGGVYENTVLDPEGMRIQRFWIHTKP